MTQNNITFSSVKTHGYPRQGWPIILKDQQGPDEDGGVINAVDIDWNGALVGTKTINTTGDLLEWIQNGQASSSVNVPAIQSTEVKYAIGGLTRPADDAFTLDEVPTTVGDGEYVWCRTRVVYSDGKSTTSYSWFKPSKDPKSITGTVTTYAVTSTGIQPDDNAFTYSEVPTLQFGQYLWSKTVITYNDGDSSKFYSCSYVGKDGDTVAGTNWYLHLAYANSADGATNFNTTYFSGALYIGTCVNETEEDPTNYSEYEWKRFRGEQGDPGKNGKSTVTSICFTRSDSTPDTPAGGSYTNPIPDGNIWSDGIPSGTATLWSTSRIFTSDGTAPQQNSWTDPMRAQDSSFYDVEFARKYSNGSLSDTVPPDPNNDNLGEIWFDPQRNSNEDFTNMYWRAERKKVNETWSDWVKVRIKGEQGIPGTSPLLLYTWIKYAGNVTISDGTVTNVGDIDDSPLRTDGTYREYIGIAENKTSPTESNMWSDYKWTKLSQTTIINNDGGTYTWIMYADSLEADGYPVEMYSASDERFGKNTKYVGLAWNKESNSPSPNPRDYEWVLRDYAPAIPQLDSAAYILDPSEIVFTGNDVYLKAFKQSWYTDDYGEEKTKTDQLKFYDYVPGEDAYSIQYKIDNKWYWGLRFEEVNSQTGETTVMGYGIPKRYFLDSWPRTIDINIRGSIVDGKLYIGKEPLIDTFTVPVTYKFGDDSPVAYKLYNKDGSNRIYYSSEGLHDKDTIDIRAQKRQSDGNSFEDYNGVTIQYYVDRAPSSDGYMRDTYVGMVPIDPDGVYHENNNLYASQSVDNLISKDGEKPHQYVWFVVTENGGIVADYLLWYSYEYVKLAIAATRTNAGSTDYNVSITGESEHFKYTLDKPPFKNGTFKVTEIRYYFDNASNEQTTISEALMEEMSGALVIRVPRGKNILHIKAKYDIDPLYSYDGVLSYKNQWLLLDVDRAGMVDLSTDEDGNIVFIHPNENNELERVPLDSMINYVGVTSEPVDNGYNITFTNSKNTDDNFTIQLTNGLPGDSAVVYKLTPSVDKIVGYKDGTYSVDSVKCGYLKTVGLISTLSVTNASVMMYIDDNPADIYLRTGQNQNEAIGISPEIFEKQIKFVLKVGDDEVDSVTIPIIHEGLDAEYHTYEIRPIGPTSYNTYDALTDITNPTWGIYEITNSFSEKDNSYLDHAYYKYTTKDGSYTGLGFAYGNLGLFCTQENINVKDLTSLTIYLTDEIQEDADNTVGNIISTHTVQIVHSPKKYYLRPNTTQVKFDNQTGNYVPSTVSCEKIVSTYNISGETVEQTGLGSIWFLIDNRALNGATLYDGSNLDINLIGAHNSVSFIYSRDPSSLSSDMILDRVDIPIIYDGTSGTTPHIGTGNMWYIGNTSTGVKATGDAGRGIESITTEETSTGNNAVKITLTDGTETQFTVLNGTDGVDATVTGHDTRYEISDSGTQRPNFTSDSTSTMPTVPQGKWLWTKNTIEWNDGETSDVYTAVRNPLDATSFGVIRQFKGISTSYANEKPGSVVRINYETAGLDDMIDVRLDDGSYNAEYVDVGSCYYDDQDGHMYVAEQNGWKDLGELAKKSEDAVKILAIGDKELLYSMAHFARICSKIDVPAIIKIVCTDYRKLSLVVDDFTSGRQYDTYTYNNGWSSSTESLTSVLTSFNADKIIYGLTNTDFYSENVPQVYQDIKTYTLATTEKLAEHFDSQLDNCIILPYEDMYRYKDNSSVRITTDNTDVVDLATGYICTYEEDGADEGGSIIRVYNEFSYNSETDFQNFILDIEQNDQIINDFGRSNVYIAFKHSNITDDTSIMLQQRIPNLLYRIQKDACDFIEKVFTETAVDITDRLYWMIPSYYDFYLNDEERKTRVDAINYLSGAGCINIIPAFLVIDNLKTQKIVVKNDILERDDSYESEVHMYATGSASAYSIAMLVFMCMLNQSTNKYPYEYGSEFTELNQSYSPLRGLTIEMPDNNRSIFRKAMLAAFKNPTTITHMECVF